MLIPHQVLKKKKKKKEEEKETELNKGQFN